MTTIASNAIPSIGVGESPRLEWEQRARARPQLLSAVARASALADLLPLVTELVRQEAEPIVLLYCQRKHDAEAIESIPLHPAGGASSEERLARQLQSACETACRRGELDVRHQAVPARLLVAVPVRSSGGTEAVLGAVFSAERTTDHLVLLMQFVAGQIASWQDATRDARAAEDLRDSAALIELLDQLAGASELLPACGALVEQLRVHVGCRRVAVGLCGRGGRCRLAALSGVPRFDRRAAATRAIESALDEAVLRGDVTRWPPSEEPTAAPALAHKHLCGPGEAEATLSLPLRDGAGTAVGCLILFGDAPAPLEAALRFLRAAEPSLANLLRLRQRLDAGWLGQLQGAVARGWGERRRQLVLAGVLGTAAVLAWPLPYKIRCHCQVEPVVRRYVAAPFDGTLEKSLVKPGDVVSAGDVLARMDGREIRWKRAGLVADQNQAMKKRDAAQAAHNYGEAQIAQLEMERLQVELQLLDHRAENLDIKSSVDGIVTHGDLERAEGAPLSTGQTLFEIAPLEKMIVEVAVPDGEVARLRQGQPLEVSLDAYAGEVWDLTVTKIQPRSEIRDAENVFLAEGELDNTNARLRPGMKGYAKVVTGRRALGWILFHKPWEYFSKQLSW